jgi:hypothetical protein
MKSFKTVLSESPKSDKLYVLINKSIGKVDDSLSITDFALAVSKVVKEDYGSHLQDKFIKVVKSELGK